MATMTMRKKVVGTLLKDLDVERVDGVDRPATGKKFILFKSASEVTRALGNAPMPVDSAAADAADRTWAGIEAMSGKGTVEHPVPQHRKHGFPGSRDAWLFGEPDGAASKPMGKPLTPYENQETFSPRPDGMNFMVDSKNHGLPVPENFNAPSPGTVVAEDGSVRKSADFWKGTVADRPISKAEAMYAVAQVEVCHGRTVETREVVKSHGGNSESDWAELHGPSRG